MKKTKTTSPSMLEQEAIDHMISATSVKDWNERRETIKSHFTPEWIAKNIDGSGLIHKCNFSHDESAE